MPEVASVRIETPVASRISFPSLGDTKCGTFNVDESGPFGPLQWPNRIGIFLPIREPGDEVCLRGPGHAVIHGPMILQTLQQHVIESGGANDLADRNAGKAVEYPSQLCVPALMQQKFCVILEARDEIVDMIAKLGVTAIDMRQVRIGLAAFLRFRRPHLVGVYVVPLESCLGIPVRGHSANRKDIVVGGPP